MIHKFISNDNKGNVNDLEVASTYTKIHNLADPVDDGDAVSKGYLESHGGGSSSSGGGVYFVNEVVETDVLHLDKSYAEILAASASNIVIEKRALDSSSVSFGYLASIYETPEPDQLGNSFNVVFNFADNVAEYSAQSSTDMLYLISYT